MLQAIALFDQKATEIKRLVADVKSFIADDKIKEAIQKLMDYDKSVTEDNQLISLQSRWTKNETDFTISRVISQENYGLERRIIINALLQVADMLALNIEPPERSKHYNLAIGNEANLERIIGVKSKLIEMRWLKNAFDVSKSVGRITVTKRENGREWTELGTGFLVEGGYLFTNYHVLANADEAERAKVEFNYMEGEEVSAYSFDSSSWVGTNENKLDFARVKVKDDSRVPLSTWGFLEIDDSGNVQENDPLPIIQHPEGGEMKIALETNSILRKDGPHIYYQTDTLAGSSGSPVFNKNWKVVALHHAAMNHERANRGILFSEIMRYLAGVLPKKENPHGQNIDLNLGSSMENAIVNSATNRIQIFWMYDETATSYAQELKIFFRPLEMNGSISIFDMHQDIGFGEKDDVIREKLAQTNLVICLITPMFLVTTLSFAEEAHKIKKPVVPVLLEDTPIDQTFLYRLVSLPTKYNNVAAWTEKGSNHPAAYMDIYKKIKQFIDVFNNNK